MSVCGLFPMCASGAVEAQRALGDLNISARSKRKRAARADTVLFSSWFCPYAQRAWIALEEKGVDYDWVEIDPYERATAAGQYTKKSLQLAEKKRLYPDFVRCCPKGLVPGIRRGEECVWESLVCVEYIDEEKL